MTSLRHAREMQRPMAARVALIVRRVARVVAVPALLLMFGGLLMYGISSGWFLERLRTGLPGPDATSWLRSG